MAASMESRESADFFPLLNFSLLNYKMPFKPKDLLLIRKFPRIIKGSKHKIVNGQIFERAANYEPQSLCIYVKL